MKKKIAKYSLLALSLAGGKLYATDFHTPLPNAPLRYEFLDTKGQKSIANFWSTAYFRSADKAHMHDGFKSKPLSELIFGKSEFHIADSFQNATDDGFGLTQNENPYLGTVRIAPRVAYTEEGITVGGNWTYPVWGQKGRIGVRASVPFRSIRMEKDSESEAYAVGDQRKVVEGDIRYINPTNASLGDSNAGNAPKQLTNIGYYNLKFLSKVKYVSDAQGHVIALFGKNAAGKYIVGEKVLPTAAQVNSGLLGNNGGGSTYTGVPPMLVLRAKNHKNPPVGTGGGIWFDNSTNPAALVNAVTGNTHIAYVPRTGNVILNIPGSTAPAGATLMTPASSLSGAGVDSAVVLAADGSYPLTDITDDLWLTTMHGGTTDVGSPVEDSAAAKTTIDSALGLYNNNTQNLDSWLAQRGYVFKTYNLIGIGDADIDVFYNHRFSNRFMCEGYLGMRLPTGAGDVYHGNPYRMYLGNGDHFELRLGADLAWEITKTISMQADMNYNVALQTTEHRMEAYKGAKVKNIGPKANADVDWSYFVGNLNVTFCHPKTKDIATTVGYEFYCKTKDHIDFKHSHSQNHWLGASFVGADGTTPADATTVGTQYVVLPMKLDGDVAAMRTDSIAHRAYIEGSYRFSKYLSMNFGGKYTLVGRNTPCEGEAYTGVDVKF